MDEILWTSAYIMHSTREFVSLWMYLTKTILRRTAKTQDNVEANNANLCGFLNVFSVIGL